MPHIDIDGLTLQLPTGWKLATMAVLNIPPPQPPQGLLTLNPSTRFRDTIVVGREDVPPDTTPGAYFQAQTQGDPNMTVVSAQPREHKGLPALLSETRTIGPGGEQLVQLQLTIARSLEVFVAVATTLEGTFAKERRAQLLEILESLALG